MHEAVIVSFNRSSHKEFTFAQELLKDLATHNINAVGSDPKTSEAGMRQLLLTAQWLVLLITPEAVRSFQVQSLVKTAFDRVRQGQMRGVVALAFLSHPVDPDDMPDPLWHTIRTYYVGESPEDQQLAFNKMARILSITPTSTASPAMNDWTSSPASHKIASTRSLSPARRSAQEPYRRWIAPVLGFTLLLGIVLGTFGALTFSKGFQPPSTSIIKGSGTANKTAIHTPSAVKARLTATTQIKAIATAQTIAANDPKNLYRQYVLSPKQPSTPMKQQGWDQTGPCSFIDANTYQITNGSVDQYTPCMAKKPNFTNFAYQARMTINNDGDAGGLIFRSDGRQNFYRLSLDSNGQYALIACQTDSCQFPTTDNGTPLQPEGPLVSGQSIIGQAPLLTIIVKSTTIYFYIDGKFINKWSENIHFGAGKMIGLFAASSASSASAASPTPSNEAPAVSTKVKFSEVQVWNIF